MDFSLQFRSFPKKENEREEESKQNGRSLLIGLFSTNEDSYQTSRLTISVENSSVIFKIFDKYSHFFKEKIKRSFLKNLLFTVFLYHDFNLLFYLSINCNYSHESLFLSFENNIKYFYDEISPFLEYSRNCGRQEIWSDNSEDFSKIPAMCSLENFKITTSSLLFWDGAYIYHIVCIWY